MKSITVDQSAHRWTGATRRSISRENPVRGMEFELADRLSRWITHARVSHKGRATGVKRASRRPAYVLEIVKPDPPASVSHGERETRPENYRTCSSADVVSDPRRVSPRSLARDLRLPLSSVMTAFAFWAREREREKEYLSFLRNNSWPY